MSIFKKTFKNDESAERFITSELYRTGVLKTKWDYDVCLTDTEFHDGIDEIRDVYIGDDTTYVVVDNFDFREVLIFKMSTIDYYVNWELFIQKDLYFQEDHSNEWVWFNIGQKGDYFVTWQDVIINGDFDVASIRFESCEWDENGNPSTIWVKKDDDRMIPLHSSLSSCFDDLEKVRRLVIKSYFEERDVHVEGRNSLHIRDVFDMDDVSEYGVGRALWE